MPPILFCAHSSALTQPAPAGNGHRHRCEGTGPAAEPRRHLPLDHRQGRARDPGRPRAAHRQRRILRDAGIPTGELEQQADRLADEGKTPMHIAVGGRAAGLLAVADTDEDDSAAGLAELKRLGVEVVMITGDNARTAAAVAREVAIDRVMADVLPQDKAAAVRYLQDEGKIVAMVGDGINDAPVLATSDLGCAIGTSTDVTIDAADITIMSGELRGLVTAISLSKATMRNIKQNLLLAFGYNTAAIPVAAGLLYPVTGALLSPMIAAAAMAVSTSSVVLSSARLNRYRPPSLPADPSPDPPSERPRASTPLSTNARA